MNIKKYSNKNITQFPLWKDHEQQPCLREIMSDCDDLLWINMTWLTHFIPISVSLMITESFQQSITVIHHIITLRLPKWVGDSSWDAFKTVEAYNYNFVLCFYFLLTIFIHENKETFILTAFLFEHFQVCQNNQTYKHQHHHIKLNA